MGAEGSVYRTIDGGASWARQRHDTSKFYTGVSFVSATEGWVCGNSTILHTTNGGTTWVTQSVPAGADATEVDITFTPRTQSSTRVDIEHRGWERLGVEGPQWREANVGGWAALLPHYVAACTAAFSEAASNKDSEFDEREGTHP